MNIKEHRNGECKLIWGANGRDLIHNAAIYDTYRQVSIIESGTEQSTLLEAMLVNDQTFTNDNLPTTYNLNSYITTCFGDAVVLVATSGGLVRPPPSTHSTSTDQKKDIFRYYSYSRLLLQYSNVIVLTEDIQNIESLLDRAIHMATGSDVKPNLLLVLKNTRNTVPTSALLDAAKARDHFFSNDHQKKKPSLFLLDCPNPKKSNLIDLYASVNVVYVPSTMCNQPETLNHINHIIRTNLGVNNRRHHKNRRDSQTVLFSMKQSMDKFSSDYHSIVDLDRSPINNDCKWYLNTMLNILVADYQKNLESLIDEQIHDKFEALQQRIISLVVVSFTKYCERNKIARYHWNINDFGEMFTEFLKQANNRLLHIAPCQSEKDSKLKCKLVDTNHYCHQSLKTISCHKETIPGSISATPTKSQEAVKWDGYYEGPNGLSLKPHIELAMNRSNCRNVWPDENSPSLYRWVCHCCFLRYPSEEIPSCNGHYACTSCCEETNPVGVCPLCRKKSEWQKRVIAPTTIKPEALDDITDDDDDEEEEE
ncbi:hypothetical protein DFA_04923 [Cavenderia fasciculata]|uniref:Uncharacterized protein n=1 Tax=Cavenderia fasciculata TaxID=261658 RepID=F4PME3_CACFS|nr:uncharacterized protein DFA_04923 [Cavenderia fasciculata]EGG22793.1 hypothetical protein DFA_04923 [Cavenderia fasciculata]|eukprot:XP_004360644.1 hypothetical protein DFA_04923 [Cavenderia fasciculata]